MKKVLTVLALIAFSGSVFAASGWTKFTNSVNNGIKTINQKEQQLNNNIDKAQAERAKQKAEAQKKADAQAAALKKQQEAQKKAYEAEKAKAKAQADAQKKAYNDTKKNINEEISICKSLKFWK
jgi:Skp family chaperone for outer membrane proteins